MNYRVVGHSSFNLFKKDKLKEYLFIASFIDSFPRILIKNMIQISFVSPEGLKAQSVLCFNIFGNLSTIVDAISDFSV